MGVVEGDREGGCGKSFSSASGVDHDSYLCSQVARVEVYQVQEAYRSALLILYHQSDLPVDVYIGRGVGNVIVQGVTRIRHIGIAD